MVTTDELREAASAISVDDNFSSNISNNNINSNNRREQEDSTRANFGLGRIMIGGYSRHMMSSPPSSPRRRTYSDESPIFVPDV
jgi:hypothetical protein